MQPLNAIDAIGPAFTRTHETLFYPFQMGRSWKLAASQYLGFCGAMFLPFPLMLAFVPKTAWEQMGPAAAFVVGGVALLMALMLVGVYLCGRMELVDFEMLVTRAKFIAPMWRRYSRRIWPWLGWKIGIGTATALVVGLAVLVPVRHMMMTLAAIPPRPAGGSQSVEAPLILSFILGFYGLFFLAMFLLKIPSTLVADFVMPFFILEDLSFTASARRGWGVFLADPMQVVLYVVCKPFLFVVGFIFHELAAGVCIVLVEIIGVALWSLGYFLFWRSGGTVTHVLLIAGAVVVGLCLYVAIVYISFFTVGYLTALMNAYAIYFLGGRYPLLGSMLEPGPGLTFTPPPMLPSEEDDEDDDPPMPMNPAVA